MCLPNSKGCILITVVGNKTAANDEKDQCGVFALNKLLDRIFQCFSLGGKSDWQPKLEKLGTCSSPNTK